MPADWLNLDQAIARITAMAEKADAAAATVVVAGAAIVERRAKANFQGSHAKGQPHAGGDKPNVVSGTLRRSIHMTDRRALGLGLYEVTVGPSTVYGRRIELGYPGGTGVGHAHTRPFPYFGPAAKDSEAELEALSITTWMKVRG